MSKRSINNEIGLLLQRKALLIGNSDGIGLATTRRLLTKGWNITGISRSESPISTSNYHHQVADVSQNKFLMCLMNFY